MAQQVANFMEIVSFITAAGIEESEAIHIAESFMDSHKIAFDADGKFDPISIDFDASAKSVTKA